jgi:hypothetical protein
MEAPHLKQNIDTSLAFYVVHGTGGTVPQGGKYFIAIEKTITCARREPLSLVTGVCIRQAKRLRAASAAK